MSCRRNAHQRAERPPDLVYPLEITAHVLVAAALVGGQAESPRGKGLAGPDPAQVNHGSQIPLLRGRGGADPLPLQGPRNVAIQECRGHLGGVAGDDAEVQTVEPARVRVVPWTVLDDNVVVNAITPRLAERPVSDLEHADRARCRPVHVERILRQAPAPVGPHDWIAGAFGLRQRGEEVGRNDSRCMLAEHRRVLPPGLGGGLVQLPAHGEKQLGRLARDLNHPVGRQPKRDERQQAAHELQPRRRCT